MIKQVKHILTNMPAYPIYNSSRYGDIYVSVPGEKDQIIYNVPANLTNVFPGEEYGIDVPSDVKQRLINTPVHIRMKVEMILYSLIYRLLE